MQPVLYTNRLILSRVDKLDLGFLSYCLNAPEAHGAFLSTTSIDPKEIEERFVRGAYWNEDSRTFIIKLKQNRIRIGMFHYWTKPNDRLTARYTIQIAVSEHRNLGYGTEAQLAFINALFLQTHLMNVEVYTDMSNKAEVRCLDKLGFRHCDTKTYMDMEVERTGNLYRLTRDEYRQMGALLQ
jgi:RimJ/RimL family protein N-acetyltransferase